MGIKTQKSWQKGLVYLLLIVGAVMFMIPFLWMLSSSFKELPQIFVYPPQWIPNPLRPQNYIEALAKMNFLVALKNTLTITVLCLIGQVGSASLVAYGFSRLRFPGRDSLFKLVLSTMMVPAQVTRIPQFILFRELGWVDTFKPLKVPALFDGGG